MYAETCTHYTTQDMSWYDREDGARFICSPPLRSKADSDALWQGINDGLIGVVSSDHCGFSTANKATGENDFSRTPNGLPGMEVRLPAMYTYGVKAGRIGMEKLVEVLSTNPAKVFGMYPQKGAIAPGSDADLVVFDPAVEREISPAVLHSPVDWSPYDGETLSGCAETVLLRGRTLVENGEFKAEAGCGRYVNRSKKNCQFGW